MDHGTSSRPLFRGKLNRLTAALIILLTANITTLLVPHTVSAQPVGIASQQISEH
jgi:hypothetical protein